MDLIANLEEIVVIIIVVDRFREARRGAEPGQRLRGGVDIVIVAAVGKCREFLDNVQHPWPAKDTALSQVGISVWRIFRIAS